jgi:membrane-associated protease RseP (regulator of RpoE activity)
MTLPEQETINALVARVFRIEDVTHGEGGKEYLYRYRGMLTGDDSAAAYDQLAESVRPHGLTPLFREEEDGSQLIFLVRALPTPKPSNPRTNIILFILTVFSVMLAGVNVEGPIPEDMLGQMMFLVNNIFSGWPFAVALLSILLAHEFGHYLAGRYHKAAVSLPYFIPLPFSLLGTMGAFITMKEPPKNKRILLDIGIAGPLAGLAVAIPVLLIGLSMSELQTIERVSGGFIEGNSILYLLAKFAVFGRLLPAPENYAGMTPMLYWLRYFFTGGPIPFGGMDVFIHPVAFAGWAGLLVTALNLVPAGQLDGGHVLYVLFGKRLRAILPIILVILGILGFFWNGWWLWMALLFVFGRTYAEPLDQITELDPKRRALAIFGMIVFFLVFVPVPFSPF